MYKTIVVHIDGGAEQECRLRAAAILASQHGAHLVGSAATGPTWLDYALLTGSIGAPVPLPESDFQGLRNAAQAHLDDFAQAAERLGVESFESRLVDDDVRHALLLQSRYADLVVLSQDQSHKSAPAIPARVSHLPEYVAMRGARPGPRL